MDIFVALFDRELEYCASVEIATEYLGIYLQGIDGL